MISQLLLLSVIETKVSVSVNEIPIDCRDLWMVRVGGIQRVVNGLPRSMNEL